ncbi:MAG TPA: class I SAM-dependent methyltransferase, partial [Chitinophagaceae bacterium]|nr:class I SAM-dependent methyltransferase [Chitinophagaceae bacterium]
KNYQKFLPSNRDARILDAGCGLGHFLFFAEQSGYKNVTGIDVSIELIALCKGRGYNAVVTDISSFLAAHKNAFDVIIFNDVIEHLTKDEIINLLDLMNASLTNDGCLLIKTPNMANPFTAASGRYIDFTHEIGFTEASLKEILVVTRFANVRVIGTDIYVMYQNPLNYLAKFFAFTLSKILYLLSYLYGRKTIKIYEKDILAIAYKKSQ